MTPQTHVGAPPGYLTCGDAHRKLGISRQTFHTSGLATRVDRWRIGRTTLYRTEDIKTLYDWLHIRKGLIALGQRTARSKLVPTETELDRLERGEYSTLCPNVRCRNAAVVAENRTGAWRDGPMWCPTCGVIEDNVNA